MTSTSCFTIAVVLYITAMVPWGKTRVSKEYENKTRMNLIAASIIFLGCCGILAVYYGAKG